MPDYRGPGAIFKRNPAEKQFNLIEPYFHFPKYVRDALHNSWAEYFFHSIFTWIDESLYSLVDNALLIRVGDASIQVKTGFDPALLSQVVRTLLTLC
ncbi:MAG TPA: hypothetical protein DCQ14_06925 [Firmicutes bacterium]|nr:hypothetical protein [Bacillota bacterium]